MHASIQNTCLLLTATINPGNFVPSLKRVDPELREKDYLIAVKAWSELGIPIVFCENSNSRSGLLLDILQNSGVNFEYLNFQSRNSYLGKGHGEFEIFEYAFNHSLLLKKTKYVIKVTGRYRVKNFNHLFQHFCNESTFVNVNLSRNLTWADSRFFCFEVPFWDVLQKFSLNVDELNGVNFENLLAKATLEAIAEGNTWSPTASIPWFQGVYGTDNVRYRNSYIIYILKNLLFKTRTFLLSHPEF